MFQGLTEGLSSVGPAAGQAVQQGQQQATAAAGAVAEDDDVVQVGFGQPEQVRILRKVSANDRFAAGAGGERRGQ